MRGILMRATQKARIASYRAISTLRVQGKPVLHQPLHAVGRGLLRLEGRVTFGAFPSPYFLQSCAYVEARHAGARIAIGDGTLINNGFVAIAEHSSISIGQRVLIGTHVEILDSDFHGLQVAQRMQSLPDWSKPVSISDDVFIGNNVKIGKGVTIGRGAVIANSAVVVKDVRPYTVVGGNPVKEIRELQELA